MACNAPAPGCLANAALTRSRRACWRAGAILSLSLSLSLSPLLSRPPDPGQRDAERLERRTGRGRARQCVCSRRLRGDTGCATSGDRSSRVAARHIPGQKCVQVPGLPSPHGTRTNRPASWAPWGEGAHQRSTNAHAKVTIALRWLLSDSKACLSPPTLAAGTPSWTRRVRTRSRSAATAHGFCGVQPTLP